jgi:thiol-disulfide isomerase/thioredoxin
METFKDVISGDQLVLVDFFATWCQPCKMMHPILELVKEYLGDRIRIIKVDVDKYGVTATSMAYSLYLRSCCSNTAKCCGEQACDAEIRVVGND